MDHCASLTHVVWTVIIVLRLTCRSNAGRRVDKYSVNRFKLVSRPTLGRGTFRHDSAIFAAVPESIFQYSKSFRFGLSELETKTPDPGQTSWRIKSVFEHLESIGQWEKSTVFNRPNMFGTNNVNMAINRSRNCSVCW